jgi:hypothetical protein
MHSLRNFRCFFAHVGVYKHIYFIRQIAIKLGMPVQENDNTFIFPIDSLISSAPGTLLATVGVDTPTIDDRRSEWFPQEIDSGCRKL